MGSQPKPHRLSHASGNVLEAGEGADRWDPPASERRGISPERGSGVFSHSHAGMLRWLATSPKYKKNKPLEL